MGEKDDAIEMLAKRLYETMERLDPSQDTVTWNHVPELEKHFYQACVRALIREQALLSLFCSHADDGNDCR